MGGHACNDEAISGVPVEGADRADETAHALLEAVLAIGSELDLPLVLTRITQAAVTLSQARYGALGVIGTDGSLASFIHVGLTPEQVAAIGPLPRGEGVLGLLIADPQPIRVRDLATHPCAVGFPPHHPPMHTFLGVPIRVHGVVFGNLYLTEKRAGEEFDQEDEDTVSALARAAGIAIENARLFASAQEREKWLEARARISREALSGASVANVAGTIVVQARVLLEADLALLVVAESDGGPRELGATTVASLAGDVVADPRRVRVVAADGSAAVLFRAGTVLDAGESVAGHDWPSEVAQLPDLQEAPWLRSTAQNADLGPGGLIPVHGPDGSHGAIILGRRRGAPVLPASLMPLMAEFGRQAALALELALRRREAERMAVLEDRERIGHDLHDVVIQRLFATGMVLQSLGARITQPDVARQVSQVVDELDDTITQIRSTIFALHEGPRDLRMSDRVVAVVEAVTPALGFPPSLCIEGRVDELGSAALEDQVLAVLTEALSNTARHAHATHVDVLVKADANVLVHVCDNGAGITEGTRRSGLSNLAERARARGGQFFVRRRQAGGTELSWFVPILASTVEVGAEANGEVVAPPASG